MRSSDNRISYKLQLCDVAKRHYSQKLRPLCKRAKRFCITFTHHLKFSSRFNRINFNYQITLSILNSTQTLIELRDENLGGGKLALLKDLINANFPVARYALLCDIARNFFFLNVFFWQFIFYSDFPKKIVISG
jgi:hypothetical protein